MPIGKLTSPVNRTSIESVNNKKGLYKVTDIGQQVMAVDNSAKSTTLFYRPYVKFLNDRKTRFDALYQQIDSVQNELVNYRKSRSLQGSDKALSAQRVESETDHHSEPACRDPERLRARAALLDEKMKIIRQQREARMANSHRLAMSQGLTAKNAD